MTTRATEPEAARAAERPSGFDRRLIAPMILGAVLNPINSSMIAVALVPIGQAFGAPPSRTAWLVSALYLATAVGQPVVGRLVDRYGARRLYLVGTALTGVAGLIGMVAPSLGVLIVARVLLGLGTCAGYPAAMSLLRHESRRTGQDNPGGVLTALAISAQTVAAVGPTLGGLLIGIGGWHTIFAVNVPLSLACLVLGVRRMPKTTAGAPSGGLDLPGMALFTALLTAVLLLLMSPRVGNLYLVPVAVAAGAGLVVRELRTADPFLDLRVLGGNLPLIATYARNLLTFTVSYAWLYGYTQWLEESRGLSASAAGLVLLPLFVTAIGVSALTGRRRGVRGKLLVGAATQIAACALLLAVHPGTGTWLLVTVAVLAGVPQGLLGLANQNALYHQADPARIGSSAGLLRTFTYLGAMVAAAASAAAFGPGADTAGLHALAFVMLASAALLLVVVLLDRSLRRIGAPAGAASA
ncbi:MFS transporter [Micromonospora costi]|uniref:MFS transporter n=1 Tax=Micromonospora costi TaxID=1530042 RepID=UPI0033C42E46